MIGPLLPELPNLVCNLITSIDAIKCKAALNFLDDQIVSQINGKLDGTQSEQDDLIFSTTVDSILYQVSTKIMMGKNILITIIIIALHMVSVSSYKPILGNRDMVAFNLSVGRVAYVCVPAIAVCRSNTARC